jgi:hypothetical protein
VDSDAIIGIAPTPGRRPARTRRAAGHRSSLGELGSWPQGGHIAVASDSWGDSGG